MVYKSLVFLVLNFLFTLSFAKDVKQNCEHTTDSFKCVEYVKNYDGDTITFNIKSVPPIIGEKISVRVFGIDTPEVKSRNKCEKDKARNAQKLVAHLLKNAKRIDLENVKRDKYFRILADVKFDEKLLSEILLKNNLAYVYHGDKKPKTDWCLTEREIASPKKINN